jgi:ATP-dependent DNA ligase
VLKQRTLPAGFIAPCLPTKAPEPPCGPLWLHEIKHDGFRMIVRRDGTGVRLFTRKANDKPRPRFRNEEEREWRKELRG